MADIASCFPPKPKVLYDTLIFHIPLLFWAHNCLPLYPSLSICSEQKNLQDWKDLELASTNC